MRIKKGLLRPNHIIYLLLHVILLLVGVLLYYQPSGWFDTPDPWKGVGASLVAAGITGWVIFIYLFLQQETSRKIKLLSEFGVSDIFSERQSRIKPEYESRLTSAKENIDIMGLGMSTLLQDFKVDFPTWKARAKVRILLLDPDFPTKEQSYADQRDREEGIALGKTQTDAKNFATIAYSIVPNGDPNFQIRLYRCLPMVSLFRVDNELINAHQNLRRPAHAGCGFAGVNLEGTFAHPSCRYRKES